MSEWIAESPYDGTVLELEAERLLHRGRTEYQEVIIFESRAYGRVLLLDGIFQLSERDEFVYHEMIAHVPVFAHGAVRRVLVIGGGDGGTARELLKHDVERVTLVEIDREVVELCCTHLPSVHCGVFEDARLELIIDDGVDYVQRCAERYDLVVVDPTDPQPEGPGTVLFTADFYRHCRRIAGESGLLVTQQGVPFLYPGTLESARRRLRAAFEDVAFYIVAVPLFAGGYTAFGWAASDDRLRRVPAKTLRERVLASKIETRFYTPEFHRAAFVLPATLEAAAGGG